MAIPYVATKSRTDFYVPTTLADDFQNFLAHDIPGHVMDFEKVTNWYSRAEEQYEPEYIRAQMYPDSTKSRYQNTDNNMNIRASLLSGIKKGDYIIDPNENVYLLDWQVSAQSNNLPSRAVRCNCMLQFSRWQNDVVDSYGMLVEPGGNKVIVQEIPCNAYRYDGRPQFAAVSHQPGITANALTILSVQYNEQTKVLKQDDTFIWGNDVYLIVDVNYVGVSFGKQSGVLKIQARKKPGGDLD